jgi:rubrerythrin
MGETEREEGEQERIKRAYAVRRARQLGATAVAVLLVLLCAVLSRRPDLYEGFSKSTLMTVQILIILGFVNFTALNWRCPSCGRYLRSDIGRHRCVKCGTRLR